MKTRSQLLVRAKLRHSRLSNHIDYYYVKTVKYGIYTDIQDYKKIRIRFRSPKRTYTTRLENTKSTFSLRRSRETIYRLAEANKTCHHRLKGQRTIFFTLTTKDQIKEYKQSNKKIKSFIRRLNKYCGYSIKYLIVPELHQSGAIHYHGIFFNLPYIPIKKFKEDIWTHGYVDLQFPRRIKNISAYIAKYLTKDFNSAVPVNTKTYFCSRGLSYPQVDFTDTPPSGKITEKGVFLTPHYIKYTIYNENQ